MIHYARSRNVTKIVVGKPKQPRWKEMFRGSLVYELTRKCGDIDVYVISGDPQPAPSPAAAPRLVARPRARLFLGVGGGDGLHRRSAVDRCRAMTARPTW